MRKRYQTGGIKKQRGRWVGMWWVDGRRKSRVLGVIKHVEITGPRSGQWHRGRRKHEAAGKIPYYSRKWKHSTRANNIERASVHLVVVFRERKLTGFRHYELQDLLDAKVADGLSFSVVDHLRRDIKQIFDMAVAEGHVQRNPALLLSTPRVAKKADRRVMTMKEPSPRWALIGQIFW